MDLESASEREVAVHSHAHHVASLHFGCGCSADVGLKCDVVYKISGELETIAKNQHAATQDAQLLMRQVLPLGQSNLQNT